MLLKGLAENVLIAVAIIVLAINAAFKLTALTVISQAQPGSDSGPLLDADCNAALWHVDRKEVLLELALLFTGDGVIYRCSERAPYTVSMMHQLRCLNVLRDQLTRRKSECSEEPTRHCLNYLRQMLFCRGDLYMDPYPYPHKISAVQSHPVRRCKDWTAVYEKVAAHQRKYAAWLEDGANPSSSPPLIGVRDQRSSEASLF
ncbi:hypothetical protein BD414DRAFT_517068 [Trametes punicea]|nr:hypothetical protein BD414DRAFT_517068 [Trametes punicea]